MEKPDSSQFDFYNYNEYSVKAVEDTKYTRSNCFEIVPIIMRLPLLENITVLQAPNSEIL